MSNTALTLWNDADVRLVKEMVAPTATDAEFRLLVHLANKWQLDPLAKQIYCIKYKDKPAAMFAGLAGFVEIANRTHLLDGIVPEVRRDETPIKIAYRGWEGGQQRELTFARDYQWVGKATVYKQGCAHPTVVEVWEEEYSTGRDLWASKPRTMIQKVAMCQALRLAFSISGLYDRDEMGDSVPADSGAHVVEATAREVPTVAPLVITEHGEGKTATTAPPMDTARVEQFKALFGALGWGKADVDTYLLEYGVKRMRDLTPEQQETALADLRYQAIDIHGPEAVPA